MSRGSKRVFRQRVDKRCGAIRQREDYLKSTSAKQEKTWKHQDEENGESERDKKLRAEIYGEFRRYGALPCLWRDMK